jgi:pimeloyl-ACP methyl ester carboxylesterase
VSRPQDLVLLLHGLGRTSGMFWRMAPALAAAGYATARFRYPSLSVGVEGAVELFRRDLEARAGGGQRVHCVGFSMGALVARGALAAAPAGLAIGRLVMVAPPNRGAGVLGLPRYGGLARRLAGPAVDDMREGAPALARLGRPAAEIGIIAGTGRFFPLNPSAYLNAFRRHAVPHDGTVEVENTKLPDMADFVALPVNHTVMCQDRRVIAATVAFLKTGRFRHPGE